MKIQMTGTLILTSNSLTFLKTSDPGVVLVSAVTDFTPAIIGAFKQGVLISRAINIGQENLKNKKTKKKP